MEIDLSWRNSIFFKFWVLVIVWNIQPTIFHETRRETGGGKSVFLSGTGQCGVMPNNSGPCSAQDWVFHEWRHAIGTWCDDDDDDDCGAVWGWWKGGQQDIWLSDLKTIHCAIWSTTRADAWDAGGTECAPNQRNIISFVSCFSVLLVVRFQSFSVWWVRGVRARTLAGSCASDIMAGSGGGQENSDLHRGARWSADVADLFFSSLRAGPTMVSIVSREGM